MFVVTASCLMITLLYQDMYIICKWCTSFPVNFLPRKFTGKIPRKFMNSNSFFCMEVYKNDIKKLCVYSPLKIWATNVVLLTNVIIKLFHLIYSFHYYWSRWPHYHRIIRMWRHYVLASRYRRQWSRSPSTHTLMVFIRHCWLAWFIMIVFITCLSRQWW